MKLALVASSADPQPSDLPGLVQTYVADLARGLSRRGAEVELLLHGPPWPLQDSDLEDVVVRRFPSRLGHRRIGLASELGRHLHRSVPAMDLVDLHSAHPAVGLAVARAGLRRFVFTPHAPVQRLARLSHRAATRAVVARADRIVCSSRAQADLFGRAFSSAAGRLRVAPPAVDCAAIRAARALPKRGNFLLALGPLERSQRLDRAVAAIVALDQASGLVVLGEGPARRRLEAFAADLDVSSRVEFYGVVPDSERYRRLCSARVVLALGERPESSRDMLEALVAGTPVVAADTPAHREAALYGAPGSVQFVSPEGSPLEVADAVSGATGARAPSPAPVRLPTHEAAAEARFALYTELLAGGPAGDAPGTGRALPAREPRSAGREVGIRA